MKRGVLVSVFSLFGLLVPTAWSGSTDKCLDIHWIDVEGGAATLLVTPAGESILIDTGLPGLRDPVRILRHVRRVAKLEKIDHLVITHFDRDHYGGAADLSRLMPIGRVYDHGVRPQDVARVGEDYLNFKCERRLVLTPGDRLPLKQIDGGPRLEARCLASLRHFVEPGPEHAENPLPDNAVEGKPDQSHNGNSIVLLFRFGDFEFFDGADLTWQLEQRLVVPWNLVGEVDVYQTNHHGLASSNNPVLIHSLKPRVAVMNNGHRKGAAPSTFAALRSSPGLDAIYQGHKTLVPDNIGLNEPEEFIANLPASEECKAHPILLSVAPDGKRYTVSVPSRGHEKTYATR
ncbi:MAG: MBL fold metallo-hydrolase [Verrucomicrobiota bacterium]